MTLEEIDRALAEWWRWLRRYQAECLQETAAASIVAVPVDVYQAIRQLAQARERCVAERGLARMG